MTNELDVHVDMGLYGMTNAVIYTYSLASCHFLLVDGVYEDEPFAYLIHNNFTLGSDSQGPVSDLKLFLGYLRDKLVDLVSKKTTEENEEIIEGFRDLRLLVGGACVDGEDDDQERKAFTLLINGSQAAIDELKSMLDSDTEYLFHQLLHRTIILKATAYSLTADVEKEAKRRK